MDDTKSYQIFKVFSCSSMPKDVRDAFFNIFENTGNDVYVSHHINDTVYLPEEEEMDWAKNKKKLDAWLIANGADPAPDDETEGETVLISHIW